MRASSFSMLSIFNLTFSLAPYGKFLSSGSEAETMASSFGH
jgi:hypothetical protein